jgi:TldD protein
MRPTVSHAYRPARAVVFRLESPLMLDRELVKDVLAAARVHGGAFSELYVEERVSTSIRLDDGKIEELTTGADRGAGVRVA